MKKQDANKVKLGAALSAAQIEERRSYIQNQHEYLKTIFSRLYIQEELSEMDRQLAKGAEITMQWFGIPFPHEILKMERNIKLFAYKDLIRDEEGLKRDLIADGLTIGDLKTLIQTQKIIELKVK